MKQIKILGVLAIALTLGLAACNGGGNDKKSSGAETSSKHEHTFDTTKWEADDNYHWHPATCEHTNQKGDRAAHTFGEPYDVVAATCENAGSQKVKCSICNKEVVQTIQALGHEWVDDEAGAVAPTCTEAGSKNQTCSRCGAKQEGVVVDALGHDYGEWTVVEGKAPTCEKAGQEQHVCSRCGNVETREAAALGHNFQLVGDDTEPEAGKAKVRLYTCANCGQTSLGFKANEVSEESKKHLTIGDDGGAAFWGRPIGNAIALKADGSSVNEQNDECVYCSTETGDYFEYVFDLTKEQAEQLATCRCYCDATPANHLSGEFWAYNSSRNTDWTPGFYIDGADEHVQHNEDGSVMMVKDHAKSVRGEDGAEAEGVELETEVKMGARIEDYRYILYVDDKVQAFDKSISVQVQANTRKEYVMPFTFHLHEGENKISLRMAGGYRSTFYNFTFRPYVEPTPVVADQESITVKVDETAQITSTMTGLEYKSANAAVATVSETGLVTGVKAGSTSITVSKDGNFKDLVIPVTVNEKGGVVRAEVETGTSEGDVVTFRKPSGAGVSDQATNAFPKDAVLTIKFNSELAGKFDMYLNARGGSISGNTAAGDAISVKINGEVVTLSGEIAGGYSFSEALIGEATLKVGENTIDVTALLDSMPNLDYFRFVPKA